MQQRIRLVVGFLFLAVCLVSGFSFAQDNQVRVGVTVLGSAAGITAEAGRDRLVKALNKQKKSARASGAADAHPREIRSPRKPAKRIVNS